MAISALQSDDWVQTFKFKKMANKPFCIIKIAKI